jgi:hypothetical protein
MGLFVNNQNIPFAPNNPSVDQPDMQTNTNSIINWAKVDHQGYNVSQGGYHTVVHLIDNIVDPMNVPPAGPLLGAGELYTKTIGPALAPITQDTALFYQTAGGIITQMTVNLDPVQSASNGYTFIPGGFIVQWGFITIVNGTTIYPVTYNVTYPTKTVNVTPIIVCRNTGTAVICCVYPINGTIGNTGVQFNITNSDSTNFKQIFWTSIGF